MWEINLYSNEDIFNADFAGEKLNGYLDSNPQPSDPVVLHHSHTFLTGLGPFWLSLTGSNWLSVLVCFCLKRQPTQVERSTFLRNVTSFCCSEVIFIQSRFLRLIWEVELTATEIKFSLSWHFRSFPVWVNDVTSRHYSPGDVWIWSNFWFADDHGLAYVSRNRSRLVLLSELNSPSCWNSLYDLLKSPALPVSTYMPRML